MIIWERYVAVSNFTKENTLVRCNSDLLGCWRNDRRDEDPERQDVWCGRVTGKQS